jgi:acyl-CoA thioesterase
MEVTTALITPGQFLYGGCGLGAALVALEAESERPTIWATAQYISYARPGSRLDVEVELLAVGGHVTQARAVGRESGREVLTVNAALGHDESDLGDVWVEMPDVPPPADCKPRVLPEHVRNSIFERVDSRVARGRSFEEIDGTPGEPASALWTRLSEHPDISAGTLAIFGDYVSGGFAHPLGHRVMGRSLDNTLRMVQSAPTDWVLVDIRMDALVNGYGQGIAYLWSEDGVLLATASQSTAVKRWDG